jgi:hypothetical protein
LTINNSAFKNCTNLTDVILGEGIRTIGTNAFLGCAALKIVVLPASVEHVGNGAFGDCKSLQAFVMYNPYLKPTVPTGILHDETFNGLDGKPITGYEIAEPRFASAPESLALTGFDNPEGQFPFRWGKAKAQSRGWIQLNAYFFSILFRTKDILRNGMRRPQILPGQLLWLKNWMLIQCRASINDSKKIKATLPTVPPEIWQMILTFLKLAEIPNIPVLKLKGTAAGPLQNSKDHCRV